MRARNSIPIIFTIALLLLSTLVIMPVLTAFVENNNGPSRCNNSLAPPSPPPFAPNVEPDIYIIDPNATNPPANELYIVNWTDSDPDDNATITLYFDDDNVTGREFLIGPVPGGENSTNNSYYWNTSGIPPGKYYIKGKINDSNSTIYNYSIGYVNLSHPVPGDTLPPIFNKNSTPIAGTTGDNFTFAINVTDDNWTSAVYVEYWIGSGAHTNLSMFWDGWSDYSNYTRTIVLPHTNDSLYYFFSAADSSSPSPNWNNTMVAVALIMDNDAPIPINGSGDFSLIVGQPFTIYADFTDNINVTNATLFYKKTHASTYTTKSIPEGPPEGEFSISNVTLGLNTTCDDDDYLYYIIANDSYNNQGNYTNLTVTNLTKPWNITIRDPIAPNTVGGSGDISVGTGDNFIIYANFTDNVNLDNATIYYKPEFALNYSIAYMVESTVDGNYTINYAQLGIYTTFNDSNYIYYVIAKDNEGNMVTYSDSGNDWNITITDNDPPFLASVTADLMATTGDIFNIETTIYDNLNLSNVSIFFKLETATQYEELEMTEKEFQPGNFIIFSTELSDTVGVDYTYNATDYHYYIFAKDHLNNSATFFNGSNPWRIIITDNDPPVIINGSGDVFIATGETFVIYANFTDNIGVKEARIHYQKGPTGTELFKYMVESPFVDGLFTISNTEMNIFTETDDSDYLYSITALDDEGNEVVFPDPENLYFSIIIIDDDDPEIIDGTGDIDTTTGESFKIYANFTDNIDVDNASIYFYYKSTPLQFYTIGYMQKSAGSGDGEGRFSITSAALEIDTTNDDADYLYHVIARDSGGNTVNYTSTEHMVEGYFGFFISITDDDLPTVLSGSGDIITTTGETFTIYANFTDNIGVETAEIFYKSEAESEWNFADLIRISSEDHLGLFYISNKELGINTTSDDTDYQYYVIAKDKNLLECEYCPEIAKPAWNITVNDNDPPFAVAGNDLAVDDGTEVEFDAADSSDNLGIVSYYWEFIYNSEEKMLTGEQILFVFIKPGNYFVTLTVTDAAGNQDSDNLWVNVTYIDRIAPDILSVTPVNQSENVQIDTNIVLEFNEPMDIDENNILFFNMEDSNGDVIPGGFCYTENFDQDMYILTFDPENDLDYEETYYFSISPAPTDISGNTLEQGGNWWFETIAEDSDDDGLPDWWEEQHFGASKINEVGPSADPDDDGFTNLEEYLGNTDPTNPRSHPEVTEPEAKQDNTLVAIVGVIAIFVIVIFVFFILITRKSKQWKSEVKNELEGEEGEESEEAVPETVEDAGEAEEKEALSEPDEKGELEKEPESPEAEEEPEIDEGEDETLSKELDAEVEVKAKINDFSQKGAELYRKGEYAEAIVEWQKILEIESGHPEIIDNIRDAMGKLTEDK